MLLEPANADDTLQGNSHAVGAIGDISGQPQKHQHWQRQVGSPACNGIDATGKKAHRGEYEE